MLADAINLLCLSARQGSNGAQYNYSAPAPASLRQDKFRGLEALEASRHEEVGTL